MPSVTAHSMTNEQLRVLLALNRLLNDYAALKDYVAVIERRQGAANPLAQMDAVLLPSLRPPLNRYHDLLTGYFSSRGMHN